MRAGFFYLFFVLLGLTSCGKKNSPAPLPTPMPTPSKMLIGFNQNWSFLPAFYPGMLSNINLLKPQILRYPGGTVTYDWDWVTGKRPGTNGAPHLVSDVKALTDATNAKWVFVVNILNRTVADQIDMLNAIKNTGVAVENIELGNELYSNDAEYVAAFPTGTDYANKCVQWIPQLRAAFPSAKISAVLQCRNAESSNQRFSQWNNLVVTGTSSVVDAYTYHIYIPVGGSYASRKAEFEQVVNNTNTGSKPLWVTEYGNQNDLTDPNYYKALDSLANYVESYPKITMALNHLVVGNNKNKLTSDGSTFTTEGQLFLTRASKR